MRVNNFVNVMGRLLSKKDRREIINPSFSGLKFCMTHSYKEKESVT